MRETAYREIYFDPQEDITPYELARLLQFIFTECTFYAPRKIFPIKVSTESDWAAMRAVLQEQYPGAVRHLRGVGSRE